MIGDAETSVPMARLVTRSSGWALTRTRPAWTGDGARGWRGPSPRARSRAGRIRAPSSSTSGPAGWWPAPRRGETGSLVRLAVYRTTDAGATWTWLPQPPDVQRAVLSSPTRGWAVVMGQAAATNPDRGPAGLYTTTDAGQTWRRMGLLPPPSLRGTRGSSCGSRPPQDPRDGFLPVEFRAGGGAARRARSRWLLRHRRRRCDLDAPVRAAGLRGRAVRPGPATPAASASCWPWSATRRGRS